MAGGGLKEGADDMDDNDIGDLQQSRQEAETDANK